MTATRREIKAAAQEALMDSLICSAERAQNGGASKAVIAEMDEQMKRIEKLFGYIPGSWGRWG